MSEQQHPFVGDLYWREACKIEGLETIIAALRAELAAALARAERAETRGDVLVAEVARWQADAKQENAARQDWHKRWLEDGERLRAQRDAALARAEKVEKALADCESISEARFQRINALECWNKEEEADLFRIRVELARVTAERDAARAESDRLFSSRGTVYENLQQSGADLDAARTRLRDLAAAAQRAKHELERAAQCQQAAALRGIAGNAIDILRPCLRAAEEDGGDG